MKLEKKETGVKEVNECTYHAQKPKVQLQVFLIWSRSWFSILNGVESVLERRRPESWTAVLFMEGVHVTKLFHFLYSWGCRNTVHSTYNNTIKTRTTDSYDWLSLNLDWPKKIPKLMLTLHPYAQSYCIYPRNERIISFGKERLRRDFCCKNHPCVHALQLSRYAELGGGGTLWCEWLRNRYNNANVITQTNWESRARRKRRKRQKLLITEDSVIRGAQNLFNS